MRATQDASVGGPATDADDDPQAFGDLLWTFRRDIHRYLARRCPGDADDLLVDVWVAAFNSRQTFDSQIASERVWLFGVARNVLRAHHRTVARDSLLRKVRSVEQSEDWTAVDDRIDASRLSEALHEALARLDPRDRGVLLLVAWEGLLPAEAAAVLGIPQGTARSRLHRARRVLQDALAERS